MKKGIVGMRVELARNHYLPGEEIKAMVKIDNT